MTKTNRFKRALAGSLALAISVIWGCNTMPHSADKPSNIVQIVAGTYSQQGSQGIYRFSYDAGTGKMSGPELLIASDNPSYLAVSGSRLYVVNELDQGRMSTLSLDAATGTAREVSRKPTDGAAPCYVSADPSGHYLATANYNGGSISIFRLDEKGLPVADAVVREHTGRTGPDQDRQDAPHAHWVQWDPQGQNIYSVDLGLDEIKQFDFDRDSGLVSEARTALRLQPGDGPRHMFFHPKLAITYVLNELSNTVVVAALSDRGELVERQRLSTLPPGFSDHSQAAHIHVADDGRHLYVSNRGHNSITTFSIAEKGHLTWLDNVGTGGDWPRHFLMLEEAGVLLVANQESNNIVQMIVQPDGTLRRGDHTLSLPQPTFLGRLERPN